MNRSKKYFLCIDGILRNIKGFCKSNEALMIDILNKTSPLIFDKKIIGKINRAKTAEINPSYLDLKKTS